jgi:hypothetical protein
MTPAIKISILWAKLRWRDNHPRIKSNRVEDLTSQEENIQTKSLMFPKKTLNCSTINTKKRY